MATSSTSSNRGAATRDTLLISATAEFAQRGFHAVSLKDIADATGINSALIAYHFRNKEGLYTAVFENIVQQFGARIGPLAHEVQAELAAAPAVITQAQREQALARIEQVAERMLTLMCHDESTAWAQLIMREQQFPTAAFDLLYEGFMRRMLGMLQTLVDRAQLPGHAPVCPTFVPTLLGQLMVFRAAREAILRHLGWEGIGPDQLDQIKSQVSMNIRRMLGYGD